LNIAAILGIKNGMQKIINIRIMVVSESKSTLLNPMCSNSLEDHPRALVNVIFEWFGGRVGTKIGIH
jgi:hypothetical protein